MLNSLGYPKGLFDVRAGCSNRTPADNTVSLTQVLQGFKCPSIPKCYLGTIHNRGNTCMEDAFLE